MIDIHSHILPYIDDGSESLNDSVYMIKKAKEFGIRKIFATSHYFEGRYNNSKNDIIARVKYLNEFLKNNNIDIEVVSGCEILICPDLIEKLNAGELATLNNSRYVLIEFPLKVKLPNLDRVLGNIIQNGYVPIIAHPERYSYYQRDISDLIKYVKMGVLLQLNIFSVNKNCEKEVRKTAIKLLENNLIHFWGSDLHSFRCVYDIDTKSCFNELKKHVKDEYYNRITEVNPYCVYNDLEIKNN